MYFSQHRLQDSKTSTMFQHATYILADVAAFFVEDAFSDVFDSWRLKIFSSSLGDENELDCLDEAGLLVIYASSAGAILLDTEADFNFCSWLAAWADCSLLNAVRRDLAGASCGDDFVDDTGDDGLDETEESGDFVSWEADCFLILNVPPGFFICSWKTNNRIVNKHNENADWKKK
jgi:hypothetical protein